jgi:hypothetical protein
VPRIPNWLFYVVTLTVVGLWAVGIVLSLASPDFHMPPSLSGVIPVVLVGMYTAKANSDSKQDRDDRNSGDDEDE